MRETATAAEVRANFIIEDIDEAVKTLVETMSDQLDYDTSGELLEAAINTVTQEEADSADYYSKLAWIARQCFLMGFADAFRKSAEAARMGYNELFQVGEGVNPSTSLKSPYMA